MVVALFIKTMIIMIIMIIMSIIMSILSFKWLNLTGDIDLNN